MNTTRRLLVALAMGSLVVGQALAQSKVVIYTAAPQDLVDRVVPAFEKATNIKVELVKGGSGDLINRLKAEKGRATADVYNTLYTKHRVALAQTASGESEGLRFSPHVYNSMEEMDQAAAIVRKLV